MFTQLGFLGHDAGHRQISGSRRVSYVCVVFAVLSPPKAIIFILLQQGLFGFYTGAAFAPNHKGMPILQPGDQHDFLRRQVLTSRNVRGGWLTDLALGGLNYQILRLSQRPSCERDPHGVSRWADRAMPSTLS